MSHAPAPEEAGPGPQGTRPTEGYLFVVTYGRSGSTVLMNVLNSIPGVVIRGENLHVLRDLRKIVDKLESHPRLAERRAAAGRSQDQQSRERARKRGTTPEDPWYGAEHVEPETIGRALCDGFVETVLNVPPGTRLAGFKEVRYLNNPKEIEADLDFLQRFFPSARFVFLTRNHEKVMASGWFVRSSRIVVRRRLRAADAAFSRYAARYPEICRILTYESFAGRPEGFRPIFDFLGAPFDAGAVEAVLGRQLQHMSKPSASKAETVLFNPTMRFMHLTKTLLGR